MNRSVTKRERLAPTKEVESVNPRQTTKADSSRPSLSFFEASSRLFDMLGSATRIRIVWILDEAEMSENDFSFILGATQPALSHHLALMRHAGLIDVRREGKNRVYSLTETGAEVSDILQQMNRDQQPPRGHLGARIVNSTMTSVRR